MTTTFAGSSGDDTVHITSAGATISGGTVGTFTGTSFQVAVDGGKDLVIASASVTVSILGGAGNDTVFAGSFSVASIDGSAGDDIVFASDNSHASILGGIGNDTFFVR